MTSTFKNNLVYVFLKRQNKHASVGLNPPEEKVPPRSYNVPTASQCSASVSSVTVSFTVSEVQCVFASVRHNIVNGNLYDRDCLA